MAAPAAQPGDPRFAEIYRPLIENDRERALRELGEHVRQAPDSVAAWSMLAVAHQRCLDFAAMGEAARRILALEPGHKDALHQLALAGLTRGDYPAAAEAYQRTFEATRSSFSAYALAVLRHRQGDLAGAAAAFDICIRTPQPTLPTEAPALRGMMAVLRDQGRPLAADRYAQMLLEHGRRLPLSVASVLLERDQSTAFHEWLALAEKSRFAAVLRRAEAAEPDGGRAPATFDLPDQRDALLAYAATAGADALYIVKPARGSGGQGIFVTADPRTAAAREGVVVQRYVERPYLIDGRKGHLRIYALVTSAEPLRAYIYREGVVRFAPEPYDPRPERLGEASMHVTNTALHTGHPGLVISQDPSREDEGVIWTLSALLRRMAADGREPEAVFASIRAQIAWFFRQLQRDGLFSRQAQHGSRRSFGPKLIGFDVLLDAGGQPWLIEMQTSPALTGSPLVNRVNGELLGDIFRLSVGVLADDHLSAQDLESMRRDPAALDRAELAHERRSLGRFQPLFG